MSQKDANYWRAKYRELLKEQEQQGGKANPDLQTAIEQLAQTAALLDKNLANGLNPVFQQAKRREWGRLGQLALLQQTLDSFQQHIKITREREQLAISALTESLLAMPLDEQSRKLCKGLAAAHKRQAFFNEWAPFLESLATIKPRPISADEYPKEPGVLAKLFGSRQASVEAHEPDVAASIKPEIDQRINDPEIDSKTSQLSISPSVDDANRSSSDNSEVTDPSKDDVADLMGLSGQLIRRGEADDRTLHEPAFSKISDRISMVLGDLLAQIEPQEAVADKATAAKLRIDKGLNWYELVPTLEDIRDLVMALIISAKQDFQQYLLTLLEQINQLIAMTNSTAYAFREREKNLLVDVESEVDLLAHAAKSVNDVTALKQVVESRVQALAGLLSRSRTAAAEQDAASQEIKSLQDLVQNLQREAAEKQAELELNQQKARTDSLTGLANREAYNERAHHEIERYRRYQRPLSLIVCDIDHFKKFNDNYSHQVGDRVLKVVSNAIEKQLRDVDFMARYGGEEFVVLMPETDAQGALIKMNKIRNAVANTKFKFKEHQLSITFSSGIAQIKEGDTVSSLFARADKLLYEAKHQGRNCCVAEGV